MGVKCDTSCFIEKAIKVHGDKYDYSLVNYVDNKTKVKIICPIHGVFEQQPNDHTSHKNGCRKCSQEIQKQKVSKTTEEVIQKFKRQYGDKYDYSKFEYNGVHNKSIVICNLHGEFSISANSHHQGVECNKCKRLQTKIKKGQTFYKSLISEDDFFQRANEKHKGKYDYTDTKYIDYNSYIEFRCKKHDCKIQQIAKSHLYNKGGCKMCKKEAVCNKHLKTPQDFINQSTYKHDGYYNYDKSNYVNSKTKLIITCPLHGDFEQNPNDHLNGHGCKNCGQKGSTYNITKAERNKEDWSKIQTVLYLIELKSNEEHYLKIGISNEKELRHSVLERVSKCKIVGSLLIDIDLYNAVIIEQTTLKDMKDCKYVPMHNYPGYTECFNLSCKNILEGKISQFLENNSK